MIKYAVGIDPGINGAFAIIEFDDTEKKIKDIMVAKTPYMEIATTKKLKSGKYKIKKEYDIASMNTLFKDYFDDVHLNPLNCFVFIESVHSMPGQGVASMFSLGEGFGIWKGLIFGNGLPVVFVTPQAWKKATMPGMGKEKEASCLKVSQLYPSAEYKTKGKPDDGKGDAILIAHYGIFHAGVFF